MIAREDRPVTSALVGYITGTADQSEVRTQLSRRLPAYMVPAAVMVLESLPLTVNGKLDKRALPEPEYGDTGHYRAPTSRHRRDPGRHLRRGSRIERSAGSTTVLRSSAATPCPRCGSIAAVNTSLDVDMAVRTLVRRTHRQPTRTRSSVTGSSGRELLLPQQRLPASSRCPMPSSGCGSSTGSRAGRRPDNMPIAFRINGVAGPQAASIRRWTMWSPATESLRTVFPDVEWCARRRRCAGDAAGAVGHGGRSGGAVSAPKADDVGALISSGGVPVSIWPPKS